MQQRLEPHDSLEQWREIPNWPGYEVSSYGRVRSWKQRSQTVRRTWEIDYSRSPRVLRHDNRNGYPSVLLIKDGTNRQWFGIHRLVLEVFVGPAPEGYEGAHCDGDKKNNRLGNLRWATHEENEADKIGHGTRLHGEQIRTARLTRSQVTQIRASRASGAKVKDLAAGYGVCRNTITNITQEHYWKGVQRGAE